MADKQLYTFQPDYVVLPGETLKETLEAIGMTQAELAERTGRPKKTINEIVNGKAAITPETALQFERVLGVPASFWNNLERNYREILAEIDERNRLEEHVEWLNRVPVTGMVKHGWIKKYNDKVMQLKEVLNFFGIASPESWQEIWGKIFYSQQVAFRMSLAHESDQEAVSAWLRKGQIEAQKIICEPYSPSEFLKALKEVRTLTIEDPESFVPKLTSICSKAGVAVNFVPELPKSRVNGATFWMGSEKAVILLSLRYKSNDHLWFTFFHEAGHILLHGKKEFFLEYKSNDSEKEEEANKFAADQLIPHKEYERFIKNGKFSRLDILRFAASVEINPGIVVGRLQHDKKIQFGWLNDLKKYYQWSRS